MFSASKYFHPHVKIQLKKLYFFTILNSELTILLLELYPITIKYFVHTWLALIVLLFIKHVHCMHVIVHVNYQLRVCVWDLVPIMVIHRGLMTLSSFHRQFRSLGCSSPGWSDKSPSSMYCSKLHWTSYFFAFHTVETIIIPSWRIFFLKWAICVFWTFIVSLPEGVIVSVSTRQLILSASVDTNEDTNTAAICTLFQS